MNLVIYPLLSTRSKRAMTRYKKNWGQLYYYNPKKMLVDRLSKQLKLPAITIYALIARERKYLLKEIHGKR